jgi:hypothetical protein
MKKHSNAAADISRLEETADDNQKSVASFSSLRNSLERVATTSYDKDGNEIELQTQQASQSKHVEVGGEKSQRPAVSPVTRLKVSRQNFEDCKGESSKVIEQVLHYLDTERPNDFQYKYRNFEVMYVHKSDSMSSIQNVTRFIYIHTHRDLGMI